MNVESAGAVSTRHHNELQMTTFSKNNDQAGNKTAENPLAPAPLSPAELELVVRGLIAECTASGRWAEAASIIKRTVSPSTQVNSTLSELCKVVELRAGIKQKCLDAMPEAAVGELECKLLLRHVRSLIELEQFDRAESILNSTLTDRNRIDPLSGRAEMVTVLAAILLQQSKIGPALDLFAQHLPGDLVSTSREIGPAAAAMQAELLCAAGEQQAACDTAARLKLLWPQDPIVSRLLGQVLQF